MQMLAILTLGDPPLAGVCSLVHPLHPGNAKGQRHCQNLLLKPSTNLCILLVVRLFSFDDPVNWMFLSLFQLYSMKTIPVLYKLPTIQCFMNEAH